MLFSILNNFKPTIYTSDKNVWNLNFYHDDLLRNVHDSLLLPCFFAGIVTLIGRGGGGAGLLVGGVERGGGGGGAWRNLVGKGGGIGESWTSTLIASIPPCLSIKA